MGTLKLEIDYSEKGLVFEDFSYEADDKLEDRNIAFLFSRVLHELYMPKGHIGATHRGHDIHQK